MTYCSSEVILLGPLATLEQDAILPYVDASVSCGFPSPATDYQAEEFNLNDFFVRNPYASFVVKMEGEALIDAGIMPNDILIIDRSLEPKTGNLILVFYNGEYLVRRFKQEGDQITLHADNANAHFKVIKPTPNCQFSIEGVVTGLGRKYG